MHEVLETFRDKYTKKVYKKGHPYSHPDESRIAFLIEKGIIKENKPKEEIKHVGGGYYELPNGERIKGKNEALAALESGD